MLKNILVMSLIVAVYGCATGNSGPPPEQQNAALGRINACLESNVIALDNQESDAATIAAALVNVCYDEFRDYRTLLASKFTDPEMRINFIAHPDQADLDAQYQKALQVVLAHRKKSPHR